MRGGSRPNAGRKPVNNPKIGKQVYFPEEIVGYINELNLLDCLNFSQKVVKLTQRGISAMNNERANNKYIKFIDLFAGMGGIRLGFEQALAERGLKGKSVFVSEIKKSAVDVYRENFPNEKIYGDVTKIDAAAIPDFDYVLAGFPCQAFSSAGNRLGFEDTRGTLFFDVARIIKEKQPKGFLLENVEGLVTHDHGKTFKVIINTLKSLGYSISYHVLNGIDFGMAQARKRIYIIGRKDTCVKELTDFPKFESHTLGDIIDDNVGATTDKFSDLLLSHYSLAQLTGKQIKDKRGGKNNIHSWDFELKGSVNKTQRLLLDTILLQRRNKKWAEQWDIKWMDGMPLTLDMIKSFFDAPNLQKLLDDLVVKGYLVLEHPKDLVNGRRVYDKNKPKGYNIVTGKLSFKYSRILNPNDYTPTLVATDISHLGIPVKNGIRQITKREGLRLFGYPESYKLDNINNNKAYDLLGNTVLVNVISQVAGKLLDS